MAAVHRYQPWTKSTGPRTAAGKAASSGNSYVHGYYSMLGKELRGAFAGFRKEHRVKYGVGPAMGEKG